MGRNKNLEIKDSDIRELHAEGCMDIEIAEILGLPHPTVRQRRVRLGLPKNETYHRGSKRFSVYKRDTEEFLIEGTIREIALFLGKSQSTLRSYLSRRKAGLRPYYEIYEADD